MTTMVVGECFICSSNVDVEDLLVIALLHLDMGKIISFFVEVHFYLPFRGVLERENFKDFLWEVDLPLCGVYR